MLTEAAVVGQRAAGFGGNLALLRFLSGCCCLLAAAQSFPSDAAAQW